MRTVGAPSAGMALAAVGGRWLLGVRRQLVARRRRLAGSAPTRPAASGSKVVLASVQTTAAAKSAHVSMSVSASGSRIAGVLADRRRRDRLRDRRLAAHDASSAARLSTLLPGGIEERIVDDVVYVKLPGSIGGFGASAAAKWLDRRRSSAASSSSVPGLGQSDPTPVPRVRSRRSPTTSTKVGTDDGPRCRRRRTTTRRSTSRKAIDSADVPPSLRDAEKQFLELERRRSRRRSRSTCASTPTVTFAA